MDILIVFHAIAHHPEVFHPFAMPVDVARVFQTLVVANVHHAKPDIINIPNV